MSLSVLPLSYCTNVHPGTTVEAVINGLQQHTVPAQREYGKKLAAGLWLAAPVATKLLADRRQLTALRSTLSESGLTCHTLNAFPFGDFHSERVKEQVYLPDWSQPERREFTWNCARILSELLPSGTEGSLSTVPLGFKGFSHPADFQAQCIDSLLKLAEDLDQLHDETGQVIRLAIEPEPCCVLETTAETLAFFSALFAEADTRNCGDIARRHLGVCYDICHQAVEFENLPDSIRALEAAEVRINKVHITCAIHLDQPARHRDALQQLARFVEPRYLHQTFARSSTGEIKSVPDLTRELCESPSGDFQTADSWRVHFHVPVHQEELGLLGTTRRELLPALTAIASLLYAPHLEVETYTWGVLPGEAPAPLAHGIARELTATSELLSQVISRSRNGDR